MWLRKDGALFQTMVRGVVAAPPAAVVPLLFDTVRACRVPQSQAQLAGGVVRPLSSVLAWASSGPALLF